MFYIRALKKTVIKKLATIIWIFLLKEISKTSIWLKIRSHEKKIGKKECSFFKELNIKK